MTEPDRRRARELARESRQRGDPTGWFETLYREAQGDPGAIPWADLAPHPLLEAWLAAHAPPAGTRAVVVGCGLGDDALALARRGLSVSAFDLSPTAIAWCRARHADAAIEWRVHDLLEPPPPGWAAGFGLVCEAHTLQSLPAELRGRAAAAVAALVAPGGALLVICRARPDGSAEPPDPPWPLSPAELRAWFGAAGLSEESLEERREPGEDPPVARLVGTWRGP